MNPVNKTRRAMHTFFKMYHSEQKSTLYVTLVFFLCHTTCCQDLKDIPSVFPSRLKPPGLNSPDKLWWAKEITPDFHVCGRLSPRNLKMAKDAGFKSVLSLFTYPTGDPEGDFGGDSLPTTSQEEQIVTETVGLQFINLLEPMDEWADVETIEKFTAVVPSLKKPALLRCDRGYTIAFVTLLYLANQTRYNPDFEPKIRSDNFYKIAASMGLDFYSRIPMEVVSEITGEPSPDKEEQALLKPRYNPEDWLDYWFAQAVYDNWFIAGQIEVSHFGPLKEFMYKSVINLRKGLHHNGINSQEEVNLLNIESRTGTYGYGATVLPRQDVERLRDVRIEENLSNDFISKISPINFETRNPREFGDEVGYNENLERKAFKGSGLDYYHLPLGNFDELDEFFHTHTEQLKEIGKLGPVLVHCSDGARAAHVTVLAAALQYDLSLEWALQRLKELGFGVAADSNPVVFNTFKRFLGEFNDINQRNEL